VTQTPSIVVDDGRPANPKCTSSRLRQPVRELSRPLAQGRGLLVANEPALYGRRADSLASTRGCRRHHSHTASCPDPPPQIAMRTDPGLS